jgi:DNA primase
LQLEDDLRTQVRGQRWHGRSQKWQSQSDRTLQGEAEAQLLRLYLHAPQYRSAVNEALKTRDVEFSLSHHRFLWRQILELEETIELETGTATDRLQSDLISLLQDRCTDSANEMAQVYSLFQLDEKTRRDILRAPLVIRAATACMERVMCEKRCRHFLNLWEKTDCSTTTELGRYYQQQIYAEKQRIEELDRQRQVPFSDLVQIPWIGEFYETLGTV